MRLRFPRSFRLFGLRIAARDEVPQKSSQVVERLARDENMDPALLAKDLVAALTRGEISLVYQPKLRLRTGQIDGVEALARWHHPALGPIPPTLFIAMAERNGCIHALTRHVLTLAIRDQKLLAEGGHDLLVHVNMSGITLTDDVFTGEVCDLVCPSGARIGFEITETAFISDPQAAIRNLRRLSDAGIPVSIDDYGAGLSSLAYLKQLPASELKIDRLFISNLTTSHRDPLIVRSTIDLAHALEMEVVAEGVESAACLALLKVMGCDVVQGFLISAALPFDELDQFLTAFASGKGDDLRAAMAPATGLWRKM